MQGVVQVNYIETENQPDHEKTIEMVRIIEKVDRKLAKQMLLDYLKLYYLRR